MPVYEYRCKHCDYSFERNQSFHEEPLAKCPKCETDSLKKVFSTVGIAFKGSGFYKNDSRNGSTSSAAGSSSSAVSAMGEKNISTPTSDIKTESGTAGSNTSTNSSKTETTKSEKSNASSELAASASKNS